MHPSLQFNRLSQDNYTSAQSKHNQESHMKDFRDSFNIHQQFDIDSFKKKYIFKPFEYQDKLEQTLTHPISALNFKPAPQTEIPQVHHLQNSMNRESNSYEKNTNGVRTSNVKFGMFSRAESVNSSSKSIKTNRMIFHSNNSIKHSPKLQRGTSQNINQISQFRRNSSLSKPPMLLMKKTISSITNPKSQLILEQDEQTDSTIQSGILSPTGRTFKKKTPYNKEKYEEEQKSKGFTYEKYKTLSVKSSEHEIQNYVSTPMKSSFAQKLDAGLSLCQSIARDSQMVQSFLKSTSDNGFMNNQQLSNLSQGTKTPQIPESMSFYQVCMLLFPQTAKSVPCSVFVMDTIFYSHNSESKDIIYVFKDKKRNLLTKMKNKNKNVYELFMKRRLKYENAKLREEKLRRTGYYDEIEKGHESLLNGGKESWIKERENFTTLGSLTNNKMREGGKRKVYEASVKCLEDSNYMYDQRYSIIEEEEGTGSKEVVELNERKIRFEEVDYEKRNNTSNSNQEVDYFYQQDQKSHKKRTQGEPQQVSYVSYQNFTQDQMRVMTSKLSFPSTFKAFITQTQMSEALKTEPQEQVNLKIPEQYLSPEESRLITPSNSVRQSIHTLQTDYLALLKYSNNQIIRLKAPQFKAIFFNPLYANQKFKNCNNTQYIQALPIEDDFKDLKVYSLHFHYDIFKNEELFVYVKNNLYKENEYMTGSGARAHQQEESFSTAEKTHSHGHSFCHGNNLSHGSNFLYGSNHMQTSSNQSPSHPHPLFECVSSQTKRNILLKQRLKQQCTEVYLYYQIFEMYTYISMHYNKQILSGIFRFIEYDNDFALFQTENVLAKDLSNSGEFIKAKIFPDQDLEKQNLPIQSIQRQKDTFKEMQINMKKTQSSNSVNTQSQTTAPNLSATQTPSLTMKKINKEILKLSLKDDKEQPTMLKTQLISYFTQQNTKIQQEMSTYFTDKIEKIKNVKDSLLSKNIFKVINGLSIGKDGVNDCSEGTKGEILKDKSQKQYKNLQINKQWIKNPHNQLDESTDFHEILNDEKKLEKFLKEKSQNDPYGRKNISNYSIIRWKQEIQKVKERKNMNQVNKQQQNINLEITQSFEGTQKQIPKNRPITACSAKNRQENCEKAKFTKFNTNEMTSGWNSVNNIKKTTSTNNLMSDSRKGYNNSQSYSRIRSNREASFKENNLLWSNSQKLNEISNLLSFTQNGKSNGFFKDRKDCKLSKQMEESKKLGKKLINQKYTQWNKAKFKLNGFKTDKFF